MTIHILHAEGHDSNGIFFSAWYATDGQRRTALHDTPEQAMTAWENGERVTESENQNA